MTTEKLTETIAEIDYDNLVYSADTTLITAGVVVASGQGVLKRGTALAKTSDNKMVILGTTITTGEGDNEKTETPEADCVLCDEIDATSSDINTVAYIKGHFNTGALIVKDKYTLSEKDKDAFRTKGILLSTVQG